MPPPRQHTAVTDVEPQRVVIFTALGIETNAVLRHLHDEWQDEVLPSGTVCYCGAFEGWDVIVVEVGAGNMRAAAAATDAIRYYQPDLALFVGIAGGIKDVQPLDVVIASKVYNYEFGKETPDGFLLRPELHQVAHKLEQRARAMTRRNEWRDRLAKDIGHAGLPRLFVAPIAAGEKVLAGSGSHTAEIIKKHLGDTLAVEMEGSGFFQAAHLNRVLATVIRGVSDMADHTKDDSYQLRAADAASAVAFEMLAKLNTRPALPADPPVHAERAGTSKPATPAKPAFIEVKATLNEASFFDRDEVLSKIGVPSVDEIQFRFQTLPHAYVRVIPTVPRASPIPKALLVERAGPAPLLKSKQFGAFRAPNARGAIAYDPGPPIRGGSAPLAWGTQLFPNGEVWLVSNTMIVRERGHRPKWIPTPFIPALLMEQIFYEKTHAAIEFAQEQLGLKLPCNVELGIIDLKDVTLALYSDDLRPILTEKVIQRHSISTGTRKEIDAALLDFFKSIYDATGYARTENLFDFPPNPPHVVDGARA